MNVFFGKEKLLESTELINYEDLQKSISGLMGVTADEFYCLSNGKRITNGIITDGFHAASIHVVLKTPGGKGGFGSMLRAIGAQIEKTTNREACRDLSGRRLRDINEEQRLRKWVEQQPDREKEAKERKKKKLEKMLEEPKFEFNDEEYNKQRSELPDIVENAVLKGLEAAAKRKIEEAEQKTVPKVKKRKLLLDLDSDLSDLSDSDSETNEPVPEASSSNTANSKDVINSEEIDSQQEAPLETSAAKLQQEVKELKQTLEDANNDFNSLGKQVEELTENNLMLDQLYNDELK